MSYTYGGAEAYLLNIPRFKSKNDPDTTRAFLEAVGDLSVSIPTIHVAGTNGKGSVCAYLRAGLSACGKKTGVFTSPHLVSMRERFNYCGEDISEGEFIEAFEEVLRLLDEFKKTEDHEEYHPSFFEFLFFMAMVWFSKKKPDVLILETGLGGRLDATNSISDPRVTVITEIGYDHMEYLGDTKELIAREKAGIIKKSAYCVFYDDKEPAANVIRDVAKERAKGFLAVGPENIKDLETSPQGIDFRVIYGYDNCADFSLDTRAVYQSDNAALAYGALILLSKFDDCVIDLETARAGFKSCLWPGRMEEVEKNLILDGAHNEDGIKAFIKSVAVDGAQKRNLLFSMVADKQVETVVRLICESALFENVYLCVLDSPRFAGLDRLKAAFAEHGGISVKCFESVSDGLSVMKEESKDSLMYVAGSLYLVGEVKAFLKK